MLLSAALQNLLTESSFPSSQPSSVDNLISLLLKWPSSALGWYIQIWLSLGWHCTCSYLHSHKWEGSNLWCGKVENSTEWNHTILGNLNFCHICTELINSKWTHKGNPCYVISYHLKLNYYLLLLYRSSPIIPFLSDAWFLFLCSCRLNTSFPNHIIISFMYFFPAPNKADSTGAQAVVGTLKQSIIVIGSCADGLELLYFFILICISIKKEWIN